MQYLDPPYISSPLQHAGLYGIASSYSANTTPSKRSTRQGFVAPIQSTAQAIWTTYSNRLKEGNTSLLLPVISKRRTRGAGPSSYVEDMVTDEEEFWGNDEFKRGITPVDKTGTVRPTLSREGTGDKPVQKRFMRRTKHVYKSVKEVERMADQNEILIPIRLDIDFEHHKLRDTFTWNLNEKIITPENFAEIMCNDLDISVDTYSPMIAESIRTQINDYEPTAEKSLKQEDNRVTITLDVQVGKMNLRDRFEWDLSSDLTPEEFSRLLTADLGVGGEFAPIIAFNIHEQLLRHKNEILNDSDTESEPLQSAFRALDEAEDWSPVLGTLTTEELEKLVLDKERSFRRLRRETSRFGNSRSRHLRQTTPRSSSGIRSPAATPTRRNKNLKQERVRGERGTKLAPEQLEKWHCDHCRINGRDTPLVRRGPDGGKTLCNACGLYWINKAKLPPLRKDMFAQQEIDSQNRVPDQ
ncbi:hypothetical protein G9A89_014985 [Geosiphon pyriformis]|nr:hypothetical protein G9A89_014985 [Geosiphon pyriformis]